MKQVMANTPVWVWPLLAFLIVRGLMASVDKVVPLRSIFILPLVMVGLSLQDVLSKFPSALPLALWMLCAALAARLSWSLFDSARVEAKGAGRIRIAGSWMPLTLMMSIFCVKYAVGATLSLNPGLQHDAAFGVAVSALYGVFSGIFAGQTLRIFAIYRDAVGRTANLM